MSSPNDNNSHPAVSKHISNDVSGDPREQKLFDKLTCVSTRPGVYLFKNTEGDVIYVGKALSLKKRLSSYFSRSVRGDLKTKLLIKNISTFETIITQTEKEALILESNLIKRHNPKYNVDLKDGKRYPSLCIDFSHPYPNLTIVRKTDHKNKKYFGPFSSALAVRQTLRIVNKTFKLRKCKKLDFATRTRPCLNFQMGACLGPCCIDIDHKVYDGFVKEVELFLKGRTPQLIQKTKAAMIAAARSHEFEKAAVLRDKLFSLEKTLEQQVAVTTDFMNRDVLGVARSAAASMITLLFIRGGYLLGTRHFKFPETMALDGELIETMIKKYYEKTPFVPKEILVPVLLENVSFLEDRLKTIKGANVRIHRPRRGEKVKLIKMATRNAENELQQHLAATAVNMGLLLQLKKQLGMQTLPLRIECFDNSNISGMEPVAAMVVFESGRPEKTAYRKYKITSVIDQDDYAYMAEALTRRYGKKAASRPFPDLLMVDGGKGQLNIALSVIDRLKLSGHFEIIALAKQNEARGDTRDKVYKQGRANPVNLGRGGDLLLFLQKIRDEAHRFAVSFHRNRRNRTSMHSVMDTIPGVGEKRKKNLLKHFGSIKKIRAATLDELSILPGMNRKVAKAVKNAL